MQTATISLTPPESKAGANRKENLLKVYFVLSAEEPPVDTGDRLPKYARPVVECRIYWTKSRNYCAVWVNGKGRHLGGGGYAGGYGYDRPSAAVQIALENAGISLSEQIAGVGDSAVEQALLAVAVALGYSPDSLSVLTTFP